MSDSSTYPLFEILPDALIMTDGNGRIVLANGNAERMFGYPSLGLNGIGIEALMPEGVRDRHQLHRAAYMANPRIRPMGITNQALIGQRLDGQQFPVEIALSPINSDEGVRYLASIRDISESHRVRQALVRARYDALIARVGQLALESMDIDSLIESLPKLLAESLKVEAVAVAFSRRDRDGYEIGESYGQDAEWRECLSGMEVSTSALGQALSTSQPLIVENISRQNADERVFRLPGGAIGSIAVIPLLDRDRPLGALVALSREARRFDHDALHLLQSVANMVAALMQRRRTEELLAHSQRLDAIGQLTGGVAHDFNNLLTIISGCLQLLEAEYGERAEAAELISSALRSVSRGAELTSMLLAFARRQRLTPRAVDPRTLLRDIEKMLQRTLGESIQLRIDCPDAVPAAHADAAQLDTALVNLVLNARDAMPHGGEITLAASERWITANAIQPVLDTGHYVVFSVNDTGRGMTPETLERAVEPFFTTKDIGRGSGLGLSMVYGFARQSGGHLHIDSRLGYGTQAELYLPVAQSAVVAAAPAISNVMRGNGETVLVVEDERDVREIAVAFLQSLGYRIYAVGSAVEALEQLAGDHDISLLFSDVMLGSGMNGNELALAAHRLRPGLPVLMTSGYNDATMFSGGAGSDAFDLLRKPYRREQLAAAVWRCLNPGD
jgi:PAS domain S-box-containing protein